MIDDYAIKLAIAFDCQVNELRPELTELRCVSRNTPQKQLTLVPSFYTALVQFLLTDTSVMSPAIYSICCGYADFSSSSLSLDRAVITSLCPAFSRNSVMASPMPLLAPVTMTALDAIEPTVIRRMLYFSSSPLIKQPIKSLIFLDLAGLGRQRFQQGGMSHTRIVCNNACPMWGTFTCK
jgi:hypothetical protein